MIVDWTTVGVTIVLSLEREGDKWIAVAQDGNTVYARSDHMLSVVRWMRRFALTEAHVSLDEESIDREYAAAASLAVAWARAQGDTYSRRVPDVPDNVIPLPVREKRVSAKPLADEALRRA